MSSDSDSSITVTVPYFTQFPYYNILLSDKNHTNKCCIFSKHVYYHAKLQSLQTIAVVILNSKFEVSMLPLLETGN